MMMTKLKLLIAGMVFATSSSVLDARALAEDAVSLQLISGYGGVPLNVAQAGEPGTPGILFVHGNGQGYLSWQRQLESGLSDDFHLVAFDQRGHGNSGKPWDKDSYNRACIWAEDIAAVIRATGLERPVLVGWSRGGLMVMHYVRCLGVQDLSGIAMVASRGRLVEAGLPAEDTPARTSQEQLQSLDIKENLIGAQVFSDLMTQAPLSGPFAEASKVMNIMAPPYARRAMSGPVFDPDGKQIKSYAALSAQLTLPFLVVLGEKDPFRDSGELAANFSKALPHAEVITYSDVGHSPFIERPEQFNADLRTFVLKANAE
jgi:pimeloyl-ACP methyl ester carboxylesterase